MSDDRVRRAVSDFANQLLEALRERRDEVEEISRGRATGLEEAAHIVASIAHFWRKMPEPVVRHSHINESPPCWAPGLKEDCPDCDPELADDPGVAW